IRAHRDPPLPRHHGHGEDGQDHGLHDLRGQRTEHRGAGSRRRGRSVFLHRRPNRRRRHHPPDLLPSAAVDHRRWNEVHVRTARFAMPPGTCHLPFATPHLPSGTCHLPSVICHLPFVICHLPFSSGRTVRCSSAG